MHYAWNRQQLVSIPGNASSDEYFPGKSGTRKISVSREKNTKMIELDITRTKIN